jgi:plasmid stabilization system protein ParE
MPEKYHIILSLASASQLEEIFDTIAQDSPQNAKAMIDRILKAIAGLDVFPNRYVLVDQSDSFDSPVRSLIVSPYVVFFRVREANLSVRVLQVRHGARRRPKRFDE